MSGDGSDPVGVVLRRWQAEALPIVIGAIRARKNPVVSAFMGAGKSVFLAALIRQSREIPGRGVVVAAPRANLVRQLAGTLRRVLGDGAVGCWYEAEKEGGRRVTVSTYQSLPTLCAAWTAAGRSASLLVCDEVHGTEAEAVQGAIKALDTLSGRAVPRVGLTATPFRSVARETLSLWDEVVYRYGWREGIADRVIVPWRVVGWDGQGDRADVDGICVRMLREVNVWPVLASAVDIKGAEAFAATLLGSDIPAAAIHSRLTPKEQARRIEALRAGELKVLVHVSMLAEGADFPWLRGLLLRRRVGARVRFVQEVGRVLRAHEGKEEGVILDPFDLMGEIGLTHSEAIGDALESEGEGGTGGGGGEGSDPGAVESMALADWLAEVARALSGHGLEPGRPGRWRREPATAAQLGALSKMVGYLRWYRGPEAEAVRKRIRKWVKGGRITGRGDVSDLLGLLKWLADWSWSARLLGAGGDWAAAHHAYQWPEVALPEALPSLGGA